MKTQIATKLAALAAALMMNGLMLSGIAFLFNSALHQHASVIAVAV